HTRMSARRAAAASTSTCRLRGTAARAAEEAGCFGSDRTAGCPRLRWPPPQPSAARGGGSDASRPVQNDAVFPPYSHRIASQPPAAGRERRVAACTNDTVFPTVFATVFPTASPDNPLPRLRGRVGVGAAEAATATAHAHPDVPRKSPAEAGLFITRSQRSESVLRRDTAQVGAAVERTDDAAAARGGVDPRVVRLQVAEGEVHVQRITDRPGRTDRVPAAIVVGQARGAVHEAGGGLVVGNAA